MSFKFPLTSDSFLSATLATPITPKYPVSYGGFVKYNSDTGLIRVAGVGNTGGNYYQLSRFATTKRHEFKMIATGTDGHVTGTTQPAEAIWIYLGVERLSDTSAHIYVNDGTTKEYLEDVTLIGTWTTDNIQKILFGSIDYNFVGNINRNNEDLSLAEWALWDRKLTELEWDALASGEFCTTVATPLHYWFADADDLSDQIGTDGLEIRGSADGVVGSESVPPVYSSDHPSMLSQIPTVTFDIVIDDINTPHADATGISYKVYTGTRSENEVPVYWGNDGEIINGQMIIPAPDSLDGDRLILSGDITPTDISDVNAEHLRGVGVVVGNA